MNNFEMNSARNDRDFCNPKISKKSPVVEIFSQMVKGTELKGFDKSIINRSIKFIKSLAEKAKIGDIASACELNNIRRIVIEPEIMKELKLLSFFGSYKNLAYGETIEMEVYSHEGEKSRFQALNGDVVFPVIKKKKYPVAPEVISGGFACDYRAMSVGDMTRENECMQQIRVDIRNKVIKYVIEKVYEKIKAATGVKYTAEAAGITKTALDNIIKNIRRFGKVSLIGDYSVVSQVNDFTPFTSVNPSFTGMADAAMEEIRKSGLINFYNGCAVVEMPNAFDITHIVDNNSGKNFETILPEGLLFVVPNGVNSPIQTFTRGGITSFTGNDVATGQVLSRFDLEIAADIAEGHEYKIGVIKDSNF